MAIFSTRKVSAAFYCKKKAQLEPARCPPLFLELHKLILTKYPPGKCRLPFRLRRRSRRLSAAPLTHLKTVQKIKFFRDYEHVSRRHIPILLIAATNLITLPYAYQTTNNRTPLLQTCLQSIFIGSVAVFGYIMLWRVNLAWRNRIVNLKFTHNEKYSLARKFQIEENIKSLIVSCFSEIFFENLKFKIFSVSPEACSFS